MRIKTIERNIDLPTYGMFGIGSHMTEEWIISSITFVGIKEDSIQVIADCVHKDDIE